MKAWRDRFSGVVMVAFVPIFFTNTGLNTRIGSLQTPMAWLACGLVLLAAVAGKLGGCYLGARLTGQPPRVAASIAALMNTRALMGLIAINVGLDLKLLTPELFTMLVIMALLTTVMCGPLLRWWLPEDLRKSSVCLTSGKGGPDVTELGNTDTPEIAAQGALADVTTEVAAQVRIWDRLASPGLDSWSHLVAGQDDWHDPWHGFVFCRLFLGASSPPFPCHHHAHHCG